MESFGPALIVLGVLIAVAVAAVSFEPANPLEKWFKLTQSYGTRERPSQTQFADQLIMFGGQRGGLKPLQPGVTFEATIDDHGLWLVCPAMVNPQSTPAVKIPGTHIRSAGRRGGQYRFDLFAEPPVRIAVDGELGAELQQKVQPQA
jgi:hypothetical protein